MTFSLRSHFSDTRGRAPQLDGGSLFYVPTFDRPAPHLHVVDVRVGDQLVRVLACHDEIFEPTSKQERNAA